jgi:hypothetical protein
MNIRRTLSSLALVLALTLGVSACLLAEVDGDRATTGDCPAGERCSPDAPEGLTFVGAYLFDSQSTLRLGPVIVGGRFDLGFRVPEGPPASGAIAQASEPSLVRAASGTGTFGPIHETTGEPIYVVDGFTSLEGVAPGRTFIRIVDPATGELYDRLELEVLAIDDIRLINVGDRDRDVLHAGESELLGIRLVVHQGTEEIRAIDQSLEFHAEGNVQPELMYWDCFSYEVPTDRTSVRFEIVAGGRVFERTMEIVPAPVAAD